MDWDHQVIEHAIGIGINSGNRGVVAAASEQAVARKFARWQRDKLRERDALERVKQALRENGFSENGENPHSWRCQDKDRYPGTCNCLAEAAQDVITALLGDD